MDLIFTSRNGKVSERQRAHIEEKLSKLSRYTNSISSAKVEVSSEQRQDQGEVQRLQVTLIGDRGIILRADQSAPDLYTATDMVQNVLQRQIKRHKEKHWRRGNLRRKGGEFVAADLLSEPTATADGTAPDSADDPAQERHIVRVKEFALKPMFSDDAIEQMELLDHSFFVFRDAETMHVSVVYRRKDGNYGLIVPDAG